MNPHTLTRRGSDRGFTLIELLVAVIIIGILSSIAVPVYLNQRDKASKATTRAHMRSVIYEVVTARENKGRSLLVISGSNYSLGFCTTGPVLKVSDPAFATSACGTRWYAMVHNIADAAGSPRSSLEALLTDGWGRPMLFDENEGESGHGGCGNTVTDSLVSTNGKDGFTGPGGSNLSRWMPLGGFC